jgi:hypothetical protein
MTIIWQDIVELTIIDLINLCIFYVLKIVEYYTIYNDDVLVRFFLFKPYIISLTTDLYAI